MGLGIMRGLLCIVFVLVFSSFVFADNSSNGSLEIQIGGDLEITFDTYIKYGGHDGIVWEDGAVQFRCDDCGMSNMACYDYVNAGTFVEDECFYELSSVLSDCRSLDSELDSFCSNTSSLCSDIDDLEDVHDYPGDLFEHVGKLRFEQRFYEECDTGSGNLLTDNNFVRLYVIDAVRTACAGSTSWSVEGRYEDDEDPDWKHIETMTCPSSHVCDSAVTGSVIEDASYDFITSGDGVHNPCRLPEGFTCSTDFDCVTGLSCVSGFCSSGSCVGEGEIQVLVEDYTGAPVSDLDVYLNGALEGKTSSFGDKLLDVDATSCDTDQTVEIRCGDGTVCGVQSTKINVVDDLDTLYFDCTVCSSTSDLYSSQKDITTTVSGGMITVTARVYSAGISDTVSVAFARQDASGLIVETKSGSGFVSAGGFVDIAVDFSGATAEDFLHVTLDPDNAIGAEDNTNNYFFRPAFKPYVTAFVDVAVDPKHAAIEPAIRSYLETFLDVVDDESLADVIVKVGSVAAEDPLLGDLRSFPEQLNKPYSGMVRIGPRVAAPIKPQIVAYGNGLSGTLAAVKRLVNARDTFFVDRGLGFVSESFIDDFDLLGIRVHEQVVSSEGLRAAFENGADLENLASDILFDNNFEVAIRPVKVSGGTFSPSEITLRVKNVNSDFSQAYKDALGVSSQPVVFSGGIFSNLEAWEEGDGLALQMVQEGRDVWEIEINGGPGTECSSCSYTHEDQVHYFWPASIAAILAYSDQSSVDYVGHSNGCVSAMHSLHHYSIPGKESAGEYFDFSSGSFVSADLPLNPVDQFAGVGCPFTLNGDTLFTSLVRDGAGDIAIADLRNDGVNNVKMRDYAFRLLPTIPLSDLSDLLHVVVLFVGNTDTISIDLMEFYSDRASNPSTSIDFSGVDVSELLLIATIPGDTIVPFSDQLIANESISLVNSEHKEIFYLPPFPFIGDHSSMIRNDNTHKEIKELLSS